MPVSHLFRDIALSPRAPDFYVGKLTTIVKDADVRQKQTILRVVKLILKDK